MIGQAYPLFSSSRILRREMLEAITDYTFKFGELLYEGYSDGILSGCNLTTTADTITVHPGIICYSKKLYLIIEPFSVNYYPTNTTCLLKIKFEDEVRTESLIYREITTELTESQEIINGEIELCRFKLQEGAKLRSDYVDFYDRGTEYDTLNTIHVPYSTKVRSTLHPDILQNYAREALRIPKLSDLDMSFCFLALNAQMPIQREVISAYVRKKLDIKEENYSNSELFNYLCQVLKKLQTGEMKNSEPEESEWKVFID